MNQINGDTSGRRNLDSKFIRKNVHVIGYLSKNQHHKSVKASDRKYAVFSLATHRSWKGADEESQSKTDWHRVVGEYAAASNTAS
jgi:single-stranded DNA-binding protein